MCTLANLVSYATIIGGIGVPATIIFYIIDKHSDRRKVKEQQKNDREVKEMGVFNRLAEEWREYLKLCLEYPDLDVANKSAKVNKLEDDNSQARRDIMYELLISMFESAYLHYDYQTNQLKEEQWTGWKNYLKAWLKNKLFVDHCEKIISKEYYSKKFCDYLRKEISETQLTKE
jgi:methionine salvage enolase-phosphatase E1